MRDDNPRGRVAAFDPQAGDTVRFDGTSLDNRFSGSFDAVVVDPHVNADEVGSIDASGREYNRQGRRHIRVLRLLHPRRNVEFLAQSFTVKPARMANPRPRKYATDAERQAAYRARYATLTTRVRPELAETLERISSETLIPVAELMHQMIQFALANRNWYTDGLFVRPVTQQALDDRRRATRYAKRAKDEGDEDAV